MLTVPMFYASKLLSFVLQPIAWCVLLLFGALVLSFLRPRIAVIRGMLVSALILLLLIGWTPLSNVALRGLEDAYQPPEGDLSRFSGMIVLGGVFASDDGRGHGQIALGCAGERVVVPVPIMNQYPHMRLLFTGGEGSLLPTGQSEASSAARYFDRMGVDASRVVYEHASRNTYENADMTARLPGVDISAPWLLVTSASHMPRAMSTFARRGWNVTAYPVDYTSTVASSRWSFSLVGGASDWQIALREWVGLIVYRMAGRA